MTPRLPGWLLLLVVLLLQGCGATVLRSDCSNPRVSNVLVPKAYLVVLPFRYRGADVAPADAAATDAARDTRAAEAERMNQIVALQAMRIASSMDGTHITLVEGDPNDPRCGIEPVYEHVVFNRTGLFWRRVFHSAVFLWGEFYDAPDGLTVQTHLRTYWNGPSDRELAIELPRPGSRRPWRFTGELPDSTLSFPTRTLRVDAQRTALQSTARTFEVRVEPDPSAATAPMPRKYMVGQWRKPWLELVDRQGPAVWVKVPESADDADQLLPELSFARALTAYLTHRVDGNEASRFVVRDSLRAFRDRFADSSDQLMREPLAVAAALEGTLNLSVGSDTAPRSDGPFADAGRAALAGATELLPYSAALINLSAISRMAACCAADDGGHGAAAIRRDLERAYQIDPSDTRIATNLLQWYELLPTLGPQRQTLPAAELERRARALRAALAGGEVPAAAEH
jgi:hypothetical protein